MDTDKAYLLGMIIGGGHFGNNESELKITLPYKKWGSYSKNPERAGKIASDILRKVGQMFRAIYQLTIQYDTTEGGNWTILCEGDTNSVCTDLQKYNIACEGDIWNNVDLSSIIVDLVDDNLKRRFVAGLADTIGSIARSQRRFDDEHQILSFEIQGFNFKTVCALCHLLYSINCIPDQVIWNHPNIHCTKNPYYNQWRKGFKLRILLDQYAQFGAFAFRTKAEASNENRSLQQHTHIAIKCEERAFIISPSSTHPAEDDQHLPPDIRHGHYIHFKHFCVVMGCEHVPYDKIEQYMTKLGDYIIPFPILCKESNTRINEIISQDDLLKNRDYHIEQISLQLLLNIYSSDPSKLLFGNKENNGYPISEILQGAAYIIANDSELIGKRIKGPYIDVIKRHLSVAPELCISVKVPDLLTPLVLIGNEHGALIGAVNPDVYKHLVSRDPNNKYKLLVRPVTEEDLKND